MRSTCASNINSRFAPKKMSKQNDDADYCKRRNYTMNQKKHFSAAISLLAVTLASLMLLASIALAWESEVPDLAKDWENMMGFTAKSKTGNVAPEIKPGVVIDSSNYKDYPGLRELLPEGLYNRLEPNAYAPLAPIKIKETDQYHFSRGCLEMTLESAKTVKLAQDGVTVEGFKGGIPFIHPKSGNELIQWVDWFYAGDSFAFRPARMLLFGKDNKLEREMRQQINGILYYGSMDWRKGKDLPNADGIHHVGSGVFVYPRDISGTSYVRKRFLDGDKPDEFLLYVASMRRVRRMSGRDTQDPLFGSDLLWDDYKMFWQKLSAKEFPNEYKMLPEREMLAPTWVDYDWPDDRITAGYKDYSLEQTANGSMLHYGSWQRRAVLTVEVISKDPAYVYGKRVLHNDMESTGQLESDMYDQSGRLWRVFQMNSNLSQKGEGMMWDSADIVDVVNRHRTILDFKGERNPEWMDAEYADLRFLSKKAK
jgi:hypothetical protein